MMVVNLQGCGWLVLVHHTASAQKNRLTDGANSVEDPEFELHASHGRNGEEGWVMAMHTQVGINLQPACPLLSDIPQTPN